MPAKIRPQAVLTPLIGLTAMVILVLAGVVASSGAEAASQGQPNCGDTITANTTLHHNLSNCPNNGIVIGADDITLNLNGHTIEGDGTPAAGCDPATEFCDVGVANFGYDGVRVIHGSLRQFGGGVDFGKARRTRLLSISAARNADVGIQLFSSSRILIRNCSGNRTTSPEGAGVGVFDSRHVRILNSSFRHNAHVGIKPVGSNQGVIKGNVVTHSGDEGLLMEGGKSYQIRHNRLIRNGGGITLGPGSHNVIARNRVSRGRDGIRIEKGHDNLVAKNVVIDARRAGIRLGIPHPFLGGAHNTVRGNLVKGSRVDGFLVNAKDNRSLLKGNTATGAGDDGFDIQSRTATLTRNRARGNRDLGIAAVRGVIDGGGNQASGNGDRRQCVNVVCS
jgi:parallel beta-helix repeat protein